MLINNTCQGFTRLSQPQTSRAARSEAGHCGAACPRTILCNGSLGQQRSSLRMLFENFQPRALDGKHKLRSLHSLKSTTTGQMNGSGGKFASNTCKNEASLKFFKVSCSAAVETLFLPFYTMSKAPPT